MKSVAKKLVTVAIAGVIAGAAVPAAFAADEHHDEHKKEAAGCKGKNGCKGEAKGTPAAEEHGDHKASCKAAH